MGARGETPLTTVAQDYLKVIWTATEWGDPPITTKGLADHFGTTSATVSDTVKRLAAQGLVHHEPYRSISLTPVGRQHALAMVRRHRLIETFLVTTLGYGPAEVHDEAETLEHTVSELMVERIDALLGHPASDPHGDPIPTSDGRLVRPEGTVRLTSAEPGGYAVVRVSDADPERLAFLLEHGIRPGARVDVAGWDERSHTTRVTAADGAELALAAAAADAIVLVESA